MRRIIVLMWLAGCSADDGDDGELRPPERTDAEKDLEECEAASLDDCPLGWGWTYSTGHQEPGAFVELEDVASPVCNGRGLYAEPDDFDGAPGGPEITVVRNSACTIVCAPQCGFTSVCYAENPNGRACGHGCSPGGLTEEECAAFVARCVGEDPSVCEGAPR